MAFCSQCGTPTQGRFCSQCGARVVEDPGASQSQTPQHNPQPLQPSPSPPTTVLIDESGCLGPAFYHIASSIFIALDQSVEPRGTRGLEPAKMVAFRRMSGMDIPKYYESHILFTDETIGAETAPVPGKNVLTWAGWHTFLHHKIASAPDLTYTHLLSAIASLRINLPRPLSRTDLPGRADPAAVAKEERFQADIRQLASMAMQLRTAQTNAMAGVLRQGAMNIQMAAAPPGT